MLLQNEAVGLGLEIRGSGLENAGNGLFATKAFRKGAKIGVYWGNVVAMSRNQIGLAESIRLIETNCFYRRDNEEKVVLLVDGSIGCAVSYANHSAKSDVVNSLLFCGVTVGATRWDFAYLEAGRNIAAGDEVFINYGYPVEEYIVDSSSIFDDPPGDWDEIGDNAWDVTSEEKEEE